MKHTIYKKFNFCYGHRVWTQQLDPALSEQAPCKCRHLHGHEAEVIVGLKSERLENGMVTDFNNLNWFKSFLDNVVDHRFIIDLNDPLLGDLTGFPKEKFIACINGMGSESPILWHQEEEYGEVMPFGSRQDELSSSFVVVDFVPTSENMAQWLYYIIHKKFYLANLFSIKVASVEFRESAKSSAIYSD